MSDPIGDAARDPGSGPSTVELGDAAGTGEALVAADRSASHGPARGAVCPLLELVEGRGPSGAPIEVAGNRCAASSPSAPVSIRQQRFVCLDAGHVDCPRFVRATASPRAGGGRPVRAVAVPAETAMIAGATPGAVSTVSDPQPAATASGSPAPATGTAATETPADSAAAESSAAPGESPAAASQAAVPAAPVAPVTPVTRSSRRSGARRAGSRPTPTIVAGGILAVALVLTVAFVSIRGGLALPAASPSPAALASPSPIASAPQSVAPSPSPTATPPPSPSPTPSPIPTPTISPTPVPTPSPSLPAAYQGLRPCPDAPGCYLYRVRSGDNLTSIAAKFGVTVTALRRANPEIADPSLLHVGDRIRVPLPPS